MVPSPRKMPLRDVMPVGEEKLPHRHVQLENHFKVRKPAVVRKEEAAAPQREIPQSRPVILERPQRPRRPMRRHPVFIIAVLILCVAAILLAINFVYAKATIVVTPVRQPISVNNSFTACKDTPCSSSNLNATGALTYNLVQIPSTELHQVVSAVDGPLVQTSAQGTIVLYNAYTTTSQTVVVGTHLTNTKGLVYKTLKTVIIPGYKKTGSTIVPGSVSVGIIAAAAGPSYNIAPTDLTGDFSIVAYKGTSKYTVIYGRLNPNNSISGGTSAITKIVATTTLAQTYTTLKQQLAANLLAQTATVIPAGYIMFDNAYSVQYTQLLPVATSTDGTLADVGVRATFSGVMFKQNDLVKAIAQSAAPNLSLATLFPNDAFSIGGLPSLTFKSSIGSSTPTGPLTFSLKGTFSLTGTFSTGDLIQQVLGKNLAQSNAIFEKYSTIATAHAILSPFWRHSFPNSPQKVSVIIQ